MALDHLPGSASDRVLPRTAAVVAPARRPCAAGPRGVHSTTACSAPVPLARAAVRLPAVPFSGVVLRHNVVVRRGRVAGGRPVVAAAHAPRASSAPRRVTLHDLP